MYTYNRYIFNHKFWIKAIRMSLIIINKITITWNSGRQWKYIKVIQKYITICKTIWQSIILFSFSLSLHTFWLKDIWLNLSESLTTNRHFSILLKISVEIQECSVINCTTLSLSFLDDSLKWPAIKIQKMRNKHVEGYL